ncbi:hypothetical protein [Actinomadura sp. NEAU-AAG7]|uniref:hypothetical protein n=1 Tax=Actinomadura sp. NEAU-AAG7 TaxID=2839640 RepID=UPI001BE48592|nr:hypothetical protein [Actinomadura sp. NEAU-AAG7]MBT2211111.1 hypothetical protein [Actinomadura sp. NEAU-AAG7]
MTWLPLLVAAVLLADAARLRRRVAALRVLPTPPPRAPLRWDGALGAGALVVAEGAVLSAQTRRAALAHGRDLRRLDLIPADLPVVRALDLARAPHDPGFASVVGGGPGPADRVVVPCHLTPRAHACRGRAASLRAAGLSPGRTVARSVCTLAAVLASLPASLPTDWGAVAVVAYCAVPYVVFCGTPLSPRDLHRMALLRPVLTPWTWWRTLAEGLPLGHARRPAREKA